MEWKSSFKCGSFDPNSNRSVDYITNFQQFNQWCCISAQGKIYHIGGASGDKDKDQIYEYDPINSSWSTKNMQFAFRDEV